VTGVPDHQDEKKLIKQKDISGRVIKLSSKTQFFLVTFTRSSKNMVIQRQLTRTESTLEIFYLPSVRVTNVSHLILQQKSLFATSTLDQLTDQL